MERKKIKELLEKSEKKFRLLIDSSPDLIFLKAGSLDKPEVVKPRCQIWTKYAVPWAYIDGTLPQYDEGKESWVDPSSGLREDNSKMGQSD